MDIQYLLWLQDFRNSIQDAWTPFMEFVSMFATNYLILIPVFMYWFWDKRKGLYTLVSYYFCMLLTPLIKLTACIYRPWIRDSRVLPAGDSITTATGYSFPSGHTTTAGPLAGGMAVSMWPNKRTRWLSFVFVARHPENMWQAPFCYRRTKRCLLPFIKKMWYAVCAADRVPAKE